MILNPSPQPRPTISVADLTRQCNEAAAKMSVSNPHRDLMLNCATALQQLVHRLDQYENPNGRVS